MLLIQGVLTVGIGLGVATLNVFYRGRAAHRGGGAHAALYLTPVFYRTQEVGAGLFAGSFA
jgi:ABC-type polysaccharide/polyol phosphate export permease